MDLAFYTCFYGSDNNYTWSLREVPSLKYNCYYYTNNKNMIEHIKHTKWIGIFDDKPTHDDTIESCMAGKHVKTSPHKYSELQNYTYVCYLDNRLDKVNIEFVESLIHTYFVEQNYALLLRQHYLFQGSVWREFNESMLQYRYQIQGDRYKSYINKQISNGLSEETSYHCACGFLIRNMKHEKINQINETWYEHIQECGVQDQISFYFVKQLFNGYIHAFSEDPYKS
jgi:hypothetical protein